MTEIFIKQATFDKIKEKCQTRIYTLCDTVEKSKGVKRILE